MALFTPGKTLVFAGARSELSHVIEDRVRHGKFVSGSLAYRLARSVQYGDGVVCGSKSPSIPYLIDDEQVGFFPQRFRPSVVEYRPGFVSGLCRETNDDLSGPLAVGR